MSEIVRVSKLPVVQKAPTPKKQALRLHLEHGYAPSAACRKAKVTDSFRHSALWKTACAEFHAGTQVLKAEPAAADPEIDALLKEIDSRSPQAIPIPSAPPVDRSCATEALMSEKGQPVAENPAEDQLTELEARTQALFAEKAMTQEEWIAKKFPPRFDEPVAIEGIVGLDVELESKDPELYATLTRPSTMKIIQAGYEAADRERHQLAYHLWQKRDHESGVGGGSYCEETPTMRAAREAANQR
jgi:hypothetical protein